MDHQLEDIFVALLNAVGDNTVDLPAPSPQQTPSTHVESILCDVERELGTVAESDYFKCSRDRFAHLIGLAKRQLSPGSHIVDIGNAPGYLGLALHRAGFRISGINVSDAWNSSYASASHLTLMSVKSCDVETNPLPFPDCSADSIMFTEVLEHIAIVDPAKILAEFRRVLRPGGVVMFSTPNVCNVSNLIALCKGLNIFWQPSQFYGSTDRHNREYTPAEVRNLFIEAGFEVTEFYGASDHANWRFGAAADTYELLNKITGESPLLRNTIIASFKRP